MMTTADVCRVSFLGEGRRGWLVACDWYGVRAVRCVSVRWQSELSYGKTKK
jgi:hypothetical protein